MEVVGKWTIYTDWGCRGQYIKTVTIFRSDGSFYIPGFPSLGKWFQKDGMILWKLDDSISTYAGNIVGNSMTGMMSDLNEVKGCWCAVKEGSTTSLAIEEKAEFEVPLQKISE